MFVIYLQIKYYRITFIVFIFTFFTVHNFLIYTELNNNLINFNISFYNLLQVLSLSLSLSLSHIACVCFLNYLLVNNQSAKIQL